MDREAIVLDDIVDAKSNLRDLVAQFIELDEPAVMAVLDERVTADRPAFSIKGSAHGPRLGEESTTGSEVSDAHLKPTDATSAVTA